MAIISFLTGALLLWAAVESFNAMSALSTYESYGLSALPGWYSPVMMLVGVLCPIAGAAMIAGGVFALLRKAKGPLLVIIGGAAAIIAVVVSIVASKLMIDSVFGDLSDMLGGISVPTPSVVSADSILVILLAAAAIALAFLKPTRQYCSQ
ncbi:hypothetical protein MBRU_02480 [Mycolicibacterium brumae DSM 44177]|nr:hypothetical protein MBRU_02480 [Mycolicibacterium brumae DSM 44177]